VVQEAIEEGANLIVAHHPIIFKGIKSLTGKNYVERTLIKAIKNDIAIYAIHTNIDSVLQQGVSTEIGNRLGLEEMRILQPKAELSRLELKVLKMRVDDAEEIAMEETGIPFESRFEVEAPDGPRQLMIWKGRSDLAKVLQRNLAVAGMSAYISNSKEQSNDVGLGILGNLEVPMPEDAFMDHMKEKLDLNMVRHTDFLGKSIQRVAACGGSGAFLLPKAISSGADIFITGDFKYHEFFDADGQIIIADVGHYESEQWTIPLLRDIIRDKFSTFAVRCTKMDTNPINYR
jgi:dinuclear metal center YbgI/SA1388 family protein